MRPRVVVALGVAVVALGGCGGHGSPTATTTSAEPAAYWIGDSYTAGAGGTSTATGEAYETSGALGWHAHLDAEGGTGFLANGHVRPSYETLPARLERDQAALPAPDVVVIDAGRNDRGAPPAKLRRVVVSYFRALAAAYPSSAVVVIAPFVMTSPPTDYRGLRRLLARQARLHGWAFVDPIAEGWINRTSAKLVSSDGVHPDQAGYDYIAAHLAAAIKDALARAHEHVG